MTSDFTWNGTGLKYAITMTCDGFDMNEDDWTVTVTRGSKKMVFDKENSIHHTETVGNEEVDQWYICIPSEDLGPGLLQIIYDALVPDQDFVDGIRHEIQKFDLIMNKGL